MFLVQYFHEHLRLTKLQTKFTFKQFKVFKLHIKEPCNYFMRLIYSFLYHIQT